MDYIENKSEDRIKALWKSKGSGFSKITAVLLGGGLLVGLYKILPWLLTLAMNTTTLILELIVLAILLSIFTNKDTWKLLQLLWLQITRKFYGIFVNIDPIAILKQGILDLGDKMENVHTQVTKLGGVLESMKRTLEEYERDFENNVAKKKATERRIKALSDDPEESLRLNTALRLIDNEISRGGKQITSQKARIETSEKYLGVMKKLEIVAGYKLEDAKSELKFREDEYKQAKAQRKAIGSIRAILKGGMDSSIAEELAMSAVNTEICESTAEIARLLEGSNELLTNFDIGMDMNSERAEKLLEEFEKDGFEIFSSDKKKALPARTAEPVMVEANRSTGSNSGSKYFD